MLSIRRYRTEDAPILWTLFYHTVRVINRRDYTESQVSAWAPSDFELNSWQRTMDAIQPYIAEIEGHESPPKIGGLMSFVDFAQQCNRLLWFFIAMLFVGFIKVFLLGVL